MGKKATTSPASAKIAKKHQMSCSSSLMMKALRPRVYITDVTNFKQLVQELTGNSNVPQPQPIPDNDRLPSLPQLPCDTSTTSTVVENTDPVLRSGNVRIWDDFDGVLQQEDTPRKCFSWELPGLNSQWYPQQQAQMYEQQMDNDAVLTFGDIEGWLLNMDSPPSWESYVNPDTAAYGFTSGETFES